MEASQREATDTIGAALFSHLSVVLPDATPATFESLRRCFGEPTPNPAYHPEA